MAHNDSKRTSTSKRRTIEMRNARTLKHGDTGTLRVTRAGHVKGMH